MEAWEGYFRYRGASGSVEKMWLFGYFFRVGFWVRECFSGGVGGRFRVSVIKDREGERAKREEIFVFVCCRSFVVVFFRSFLGLYVVV